MKFSRIAFLIVFIAMARFAAASDIYYPTGTYAFSETDLKVAARGIPMTFERSYRSNRVLKDKGQYFHLGISDGPFGYGWSTIWTVRIVENPVNPTEAHFLAPDGRWFAFDRNEDGSYVPDRANGYILSRTSTGYELSERGGNLFRFGLDGKLFAIRDQRGKSAYPNYDGAGRLVSVTDTAGRQVFSFGYSGDRISSVTDIAGRSIDYQYDDKGNLKAVLHDGQTISSYSYNGYNGMTLRKNALNEAWQVTYTNPEKGIASKVTDPAGKVMSVRADFTNRVFYITDYNGNTRKVLLNGDGKVVSDEDVMNGQTSTRTKVDYYPDGTKRTVDSSGNVTKEMLSSWEEVLKKTDPEGNETNFTYNSMGKPLTITDPLGVVTRFEYDATGVFPTKITRAEGRPEETVTTFSYTTAGDLGSTATDGAATSFTYNAAGLPLTVTDPMGNVSKLDYDDAGNVLASTDASGNKSEFTYDWRGNLLTAKDPLGNITTYTYNAAGRLTTVKDPLNRTTTTATDFAGRIKSLTPPVGTGKTFTYDGNGNLTRITEGDAVTNFVYDSRDRLLSETDPEGNVTIREYDNTGCTTCGSSQSIPKKIIDPLSNATENTFDKNGRVTAVKDPLGNLTSMVYDKVGRVTSRTDAEGNVTTYGYDGLGRITGQTDANGGVTSFTYDKRGNLLTLSDPEGNTTTFAYDLAGRKAKETRPMGQATEYAYYPNGLLKSVKDAKGQVTTYSYDTASRLTEILFTDGKKHLFGYDAAGNMTTYASPDVTAVIAYDAANRKTGETVTMGGFMRSYSYSYDGRGNKASFTTPEGTSYGYTYNKNGQPTQISTPAGAITLAYQWLRQTKVTLPNGVITDYSYNENSWLTGYAAKLANVPVISATYGFDKVGNIISKANGVTASYGYDKIYQLLSAQNSTNPETFTYDKVGNRKTSAQTEGAWNYNRNNELLSYNGTSFGYDANGNTVTKSEPAGTTTYVYGATDRLERVELPDGRTAAYAYDPFGRRIRKQVGSEVTYFLYADEGLIGEYDSAGAFRKGYGWRPDGIWGTNPVLMVEGAKYYFYHNDHLGTPQKMSNGQGSVVWSATYKAFGEATVDPASTVVNNLRFPGQYYDSETGNHYNYFRYYNPNTGRYDEVDPIGLRGGINLFSYTKSNPLRFIDPLGLYTEIIIWQPVTHGTSSFGHVSANVNGTNYSWGPDGWDKTYPNAADYIKRQEGFRSGVGVILNLTPEQERRLQQCYAKSRGSYSKFKNNCGDPHKNCLKEVLGFSLSDSFFPVSIGNDLLDSPLYKGSTFYKGPKRKFFDDGYWTDNFGLGVCRT